MPQQSSKQFFSKWAGGSHALQRFLFHPGGPLWRYCLLAAPLAIIPSIISTAIICALLETLGVNTSALLPLGPEHTFKGFFGVVVGAPVIETFLLAWTISILSSFNKGRIFVAAGAAILWGALHALGGVLWFFGTAWSFFVFSAAYLAWRQTSFKHAYMAAAITHALVNLTAMLLTLTDLF